MRSADLRPGRIWPALTDFVLLAVLTLAALGLRVLAAQGPLWFDEVWSLVLLERLPGATRLLGVAAHDNLHAVQVLWLSLTGLDAAPWVQRLPAILCGSAAVAVAWWALLPYGRLVALAAAVLFAVSPPLVQYGSEARGYAPMLLCALIAFERLDTWAATGAAGALRGVQVATVLGPLCHLTFLLVLAGLGLWALARGTRWRDLVRLFGPAAMVVALLGMLAIVVGMKVGGAEPGDWLGALAAFVLLVAGTEGRAIWALAVLGGLVAALVLAPPRLRLVLALLVLVLPVLVAVSPLIAYPQPRYYLAPLAFALLAVALALGRIGRWGRAGTALALLLLAAATVASLRLDQRLIAVGHGDATAAAALMGGGRVATDSPFRVMMQLEHEAPGRFVRNEAQPDWFVDERGTGPAPEPRILHDDRIFVLAAVFPHWGLSGFTWAIYRPEPTPP